MAELCIGVYTGFLAWYCLQVTAFPCLGLLRCQSGCWQLPIWKHTAEQSFSSLSSFTRVVL